MAPAGHRFDRARQGYLNLLPVQHKNSRDPGDNLAMVEARRDFLNAGHYAPVAKRLAELAAERTPQRWVISAVARVTTPHRSPTPCPTPTATPWIPQGSGQACVQAQPGADLVDRQHGLRTLGRCQLPVSRQVCSARWTGTTEGRRRLQGHCRLAGRRPRPVQRLGAEGSDLQVQGRQRARDLAAESRRQVEQPVPGATRRRGKTTLFAPALRLLR